MKRAEAWQLAYQMDRYMKHLSNIELEARAKDIFANQAILTEKGQIGLAVEPGGMGPYWMCLWTHVCVEMAIRHGPFPNGFTNGFIKSASIVRPSFPDPPKALKAIETVGGPRKGDLYKFGLAKYLIPAFERGVIRIAPASIYKDPSLNPAIRDDELSISISMRPGTVTIGKPMGSSVAPFGSVRFDYAAKTNYYVSCFASQYTYREFDDFEADACLVIREPRTLIRNMMKAVRARLPAFRGFACPVVYLDPLNADPTAVDVVTCKHFRYAYQNEYRVVWVPEPFTNDLDPFEIEIGNMSAFATLIQIT